MSHRSEATLASRLGTEGVNYRAVVLRDGGKELLVELADYRVRLPSIEVPRQQRVAQNLTEALRRDLAERDGEDEVHCRGELVEAHVGAA